MVDVVIVGAGASGLMCACTLKMNDPNINVLLLEKNDKVGKKVAITGNGRCNLGNINKSIENYNSSSNLDCFKDVLENGIYLEYLKEFGVYIKEENGLLYPNSNQAIGVVKSMERYFISNGGNIRFNYKVDQIEYNDNYYVINNDIKCKNLVVATGGLSYPKTGSTGDGYELLKKYHNITKLYPSLMPLVSDYIYLKDISGVRFDSKVRLIVDNEIVNQEEGQVQFTDYGISGICIFNLSRDVRKYLDNNKKVVINIDLVNNLEGINEYISKFNDYKIEDALSNIINNKLSNVICKELKISGKKVNDIDIDMVIHKLHNFNLNIINTKGYDNAQVTNGGLVLDEFNEYLESKKHKKLYVIGEVLDIDSKCGGYNLSWAFSSGMIAANNISKNYNF